MNKSSFLAKFLIIAIFILIVVLVVLLSYYFIWLNPTSPVNKEPDNYQKNADTTEKTSRSGNELLQLILDNQHSQLKLEVNNSQWQRLAKILNITVKEFSHQKGYNDQKDYIKKIKVIITGEIYEGSQYMNSNRQVYLSSMSEKQGNEYFIYIGIPQDVERPQTQASEKDDINSRLLTSIINELFPIELKEIYGILEANGIKYKSDNINLRLFNLN